MCRGRGDRPRRSPIPSRVGCHAEPLFWRVFARPTEPMPEATTKPATHVRELKDLTRVIQRAPGFPEILAAMKNGRSATLDGAWGSAGPLAAAALGLHAPRTLVIVLAHVGDVDDFRDDVATFAGAVPEV